MMELIDSHSHVYDESFADEFESFLARAAGVGVTHLVLPAIDSTTHEALIRSAQAAPEQCYALMGLHPTSVNDNPHYREELALVETYFEKPPVRFYGVGEVGLDLYWSRNFLREQEEVLRAQFELALRQDLPVVIHTRAAFPEMRRMLESFQGRGLRGVFHSFSGTQEDYQVLREYGDFRFGIGGVVTYKRSEMAEVVAHIPLEELVLETDCPYLPPVPFRGKRNESSYLPWIAAKVAEIKGISVDEVARVTTAVAVRLFDLPH